MNPVISVKNVSRSFRSAKKAEGFGATIKLLLKPEYKVTEALKPVSFQIEEGAFVGLIGANGAGKTTLLKILSGLIPPTSGEARVLGEIPFQRSIHFRKQISLVMGQKAQLWWDLPGKDAFDLLQAIYEIPKDVYKQRVEELSTLLDVTKHLQTQIRRLSLGERMKMELIGALIHWPKILFLDEPTIGLDVLAAHKLREFLKVYNEKYKATILLTSHNMDDIERLCSRVIILKTGELIYDGKPKGLMKEGDVRLKVRLKNEATLPQLSQCSGVSLDKIAEIEEDEIHYLTFQTKNSEMMGILSKLHQDFQVIDISIQEQSLEDVIQGMYASG